MGAVNSANQAPLRKYVAITGPIAAGASTLATVLMEANGWVGLLEGQIESDNPFFLDAYQDFRRWGFHSQAHFLLASAKRHEALRTMLTDPALNAPVVVEDRTPFEHTAAYLRSFERLALISSREAELLRGLDARLERDYVPPDLLVFRRLTHDQLRARVQQRNRAGEDAANLDFLEAVRQSFEEFVGGWQRSPVLEIAPDRDIFDERVRNAVVAEICDAVDAH